MMRYRERSRVRMNSEARRQAPLESLHNLCSSPRLVPTDNMILSNCDSGGKSLLLIHTRMNHVSTALLQHSFLQFLHIDVWNVRFRVCFFYFAMSSIEYAPAFLKISFVFITIRHLLIWAKYQNVTGEELIIFQNYRIPNTCVLYTFGTTSCRKITPFVFYSRSSSRLLWID